MQANQLSKLALATLLITPIADVALASGMTEAKHLCKEKIREVYHFNRHGQVVDSRHHLF